MPHTRPRLLSRPSASTIYTGTPTDDADGNLIIWAGDVLRSRGRGGGGAGGSDLKTTYTALEPLGSGSFGTVVLAEAGVGGEVVPPGTRVALKVVRNHPAYFSQATLEAHLLKMLHRTGRVPHLVSLLDHFVWHGHLVLVFPALPATLLDVLQSRGFRGLARSSVRHTMRQLLSTLHSLHVARLVHADVKLENLMLEGGAAGGAGWSSAEVGGRALRVIDFGSASSLSGINPAFQYIQSRFYRAPEVMLGLPYDHRIDLWSAGCVAAELALGLPVFPGSNEHDTVFRIASLLGLPPPWMLATGSAAGRFFVKASGASAFRHDGSVPAPLKPLLVRPLMGAGPSVPVEVSVLVASAAGGVTQKPQDAPQHNRETDGYLVRSGGGSDRTLSTDAVAFSSPTGTGSQAATGNPPSPQVLLIRRSRGVSFVSTTSSPVRASPPLLPEEPSPPLPTAPATHEASSAASAPQLHPSASLQRMPTVPGGDVLPEFPAPARANRSLTTGNVPPHAWLTRVRAEAAGARTREAVRGVGPPPPSGAPVHPVVAVLRSATPALVAREASHSHPFRLKSHAEFVASEAVSAGGGGRPCVPGKLYYPVTSLERLLLRPDGAPGLIESLLPEVARPPGAPVTLDQEVAELEAEASANCAALLAAGDEAVERLEFLDFVLRLLAINPGQRMSAAQALAHPFLLRGLPDGTPPHPTLSWDELLREEISLAASMFVQDSARMPHSRPARTVGSAPPPPVFAPARPPIQSLVAPCGGGGGGAGPMVRGAGAAAPPAVSARPPPLAVSRLQHPRSQSGEQGQLPRAGAGVEDGPLSVPTMYGEGGGAQERGGGGGTFGPAVLRSPGRHFALPSGGGSDGVSHGWDAGAAAGNLRERSASMRTRHGSTPDGRAQSFERPVGGDGEGRGTPGSPRTKSRPSSLRNLLSLSPPRERTPGGAGEAPGSPEVEKGAGFGK